MAAPVLTYSPSDVKLVISGYTLGGLVSVSLSFNTPAFTLKRGIRGQNTRVYNPDLSITITAEVLQTSVTNDVLFDIFSLDYRTRGGRLGITLKDTSGRTIMQSEEAFMPKLPDLSYSNGFNTRVWTFETTTLVGGKLTGSAQGNTDFFSDLLSGQLLDNFAGNVSDTFNDFT